MQSSRSKKVNRAWLHDHLNDPYVKLAQRHHYRARAAFKLIGIDEQDHLIRPGMTVVDLGSAPGSWSQVVRRRLAAPNLAEDVRKADDLPGLFADTVRKLKPGEISAPVRSPAGFHILKLQDRRDGGATTVELTHARHILLPANSPETAAEAERRLSLFRRDIEAGKADFAKLAKEFSSDGSAAKGGDLGWLYPGDTVPEFEQAMKSLHDGEISEPVQTQFGVHLVQVLGRRTDTESPERLRNAARAKLREAKGGEAYQQWLRELRDRTYVEYRQKSDAASTH